MPHPPFSSSSPSSFWLVYLSDHIWPLQAASGLSVLLSHFPLILPLLSDTCAFGWYYFLHTLYLPPPPISSPIPYSFGSFLCVSQDRWGGSEQRNWVLKLVVMVLARALTNQSLVILTSPIRGFWKSTKRHKKAWPTKQGRSRSSGYYASWLPLSGLHHLSLNPFLHIVLGHFCPASFTDPIC